MNGCNECKHRLYPNATMADVFTTHKDTCSLGHNERIAQWWKENGKKPYAEGSSMECFEPKESAILLSDTIHLVDKMEKLLSDSKEQP